MRPVTQLGVALLAGCLSLNAAIRRAPAVAADFPAAEFRLPPGFVAELVAGPPLVRHPIMAGFDDRGRLFVAETTGENLRNTELDARRPNHMTRLEDADGDGFFDRATRFAEDMTFPQGALWHDNALYVSSPPGLWRFVDDDDDGIADRREQLADGFAYTGNAADVHGPFLHPNGRLYWCHGRKGHEVYQRDGSTLVSKGKGARIWSCLPDGSDVRVHAGGGMDNPVELCFTPEGEIIGPVNLFYGRPRGDVLVHWQFGGVYPRHDMLSVVAEFTRTGDLLPEVINFGHVAVSGACMLRSDSFGKDHVGNVFQTFFNTCQVKRVVLSRDGGGSFTAELKDFLECTTPDVHFTDVLEDADGSLVVIDTGGWFRIGCPTSQIAKPDVAGAIYRIRRTDAKSVPDPRGLRIDWRKLSSGQLASLLDDPRFVVRDRAREALVKQGSKAAKAVAAVLAKANAGARVAAAHTLGRINSPGARTALRRALDSDSSRVRQTAALILGEVHDQAAASALVGRLKDTDPAVRREAATALGRIGADSALPALAKVLRQELSPQMRHAIIYALIQIDAFTALRQQLGRASDPRELAALLLAGDQMKSHPLLVADILPHLTTVNADLFHAISFIAARHPEWAEPLVDAITPWFQHDHPAAEQLRTVRSLFPDLIQAPATRGLIASLLASGDRRFEIAVELIARAADPGLDPRWEKPLRQALQGKSPDRAAATLDALKVIHSPGFDAVLRAFGADVSRPDLLRVKALSAVSVRKGTLDQAAFQLLLAILSRDSSPRDTADAAQLVGQSRLTSAQLQELAPALGRMGPLALPAAIPPFERNRTPEVGQALVAALKDSPGLGAIPPTELKRIITRYPPEVAAAAAPWLDPLLTADEHRAERLASLAKRVNHGDARRGRKVFESETSLCHVCHRVGTNGGQVGPDLSRIGAIRSRRDLLEAILYPSASLARDYEAHVVEMTDGESQTGVIHTDAPSQVRLAVANGAFVEIPRNRIRSIRPAALSLMPAGLEQTMTEAQLADLIAYLGSLK